MQLIRGDEPGRVSVATGLSAFTRVEFLRDGGTDADFANHEIAVVRLGQFIDQGLLVTGEHEEAVRVRADFFILLRRHHDCLGTALVLALARKQVKTRRFGQLVDPFVDFPKDGFVLSRTLAPQVKLGNVRHEVVLPFAHGKKRLVTVGHVSDIASVRGRAAEPGEPDGSRDRSVTPARVS